MHQRNESSFSTRMIVYFDWYTQHMIFPVNMSQLRIIVLNIAVIPLTVINSPFG